MYCDNHFMLYVTHIIMLYTLNLHSAVCQLYLNKTTKKRKCDEFHFLSASSETLIK